MEGLQRGVVRAAVPVGVIGTVGGFISDVLLPLGNLAPFLATVSLISLITSIFLFIKLYHKQKIEAWDSPVGGALIVSAGSLVVFGGWWFILTSAPPNGYLADNIEPFATFQAQLLGLEEDVEEIKETTGMTATEVVIAATEQATGFDNIQSAIEALQSGQQTIIDQPSTMQDWYNNARIYQSRGDTFNAIKAYEEFFTFGAEYVDPYQDYVSMLKASEGIARTTEIIENMQQEYPDNRTLILMVAQLQETPEESLPILEELAEREPSFGPVFYDLGSVYERMLNDGVTRYLTYKHSNTFQKLLELEESQQFSKYFLDKVLSDKYLHNAEESLEEFVTWIELFEENVVYETFFREGIMLSIYLPDAGSIEELYYSIDDSKPSINTGKLQGTTQVNPTIGPIEVAVGDHVLYYQYIDRMQIESEIFEWSFRREPILVFFSPEATDLSTQTGSGTLTFDIIDPPDAEQSHTFHYSLNADTLDQSINSPHSSIFFDVEDIPMGENAIYVQAVAADGTQTEIVEYNFSIK